MQRIGKHLTCYLAFVRSTMYQDEAQNTYYANTLTHT
jgi:hypothetical protein